VPACGSQIVLCDLPVHVDFYRGCSHGCVYCFARRRPKCGPPPPVRPHETLASLRRWIDGYRTLVTAWCDWRIPLHVGGMSDPLQPIERERRHTLACLELLAAARYPYVLSTKGTLAGESPWLDVLAASRAVVQVSLVSPRYNVLEPGAPSFAERLRLLRKLAPRVLRTIVRVQPYRPEVLGDVLAALPRYADAGVFGIVCEGWKWKGRADAPPSVVKVAGDWCFPVDVLERDFTRLRSACHRLRLRFYCAENRLRRLSDDHCCCGVDGLAGFRPNRANLNTLLLGRPIRYRRRMREVGTAYCFKSCAQDPVSTLALPRLSFADAMQLVAGVPGYRAALGLPPL